MQRVVAEPRWSVRLGGMSRCLVSTVNRNGPAMKVDDVAIAIREPLAKCGRQATAGDVGARIFGVQWHYGGGLFTQATLGLAWSIA